MPSTLQDTKIRLLQFTAEWVARAERSIACNEYETAETSFEIAARLMRGVRLCTEKMNEVN